MSTLGLIEDLGTLLCTLVVELRVLFVRLRIVLGILARCCHEAFLIVIVNHGAVIDSYQSRP